MASPPPARPPSPRTTDPCSCSNFYEPRGKCSKESSSLNLYIRALPSCNWSQNFSSIDSRLERAESVPFTHVWKILGILCQVQVIKFASRRRWERKRSESRAPLSARGTRDVENVSVGDNKQRDPRLFALSLPNYSATCAGVIFTTKVCCVRRKLAAGKKWQALKSFYHTL